MNPTRSEQELDDGLRLLREALEPDSRTLQRLRSGVMMTADPATNSVAPQLLLVPPRRRTPWRQAAAILVAAAVVVGGVVSLGGRAPTASAEATEALLSAAALTATDPLPGPGQFTRITTHAWYLAGVSAAASGKTGAESTEQTYELLVESIDTLWRPADDSAQWTERDEQTGEVKWYRPGAPPSPIPDALTSVLTPNVSTRSGACNVIQSGWADFCTDPGNWQTPTRAWIASLPRDPDQLYALLKAAAPDNSRGSAELLVYAADALRSGLLPAELRVALYQALTRVPNLRIIENDANLDGRHGTALGVDDGSTRQEFIIDPATGAFIGERETATSADSGFAAGTVTSSTSVQVEVVDGLH